jgi:hypothetical protein
MVVVKLGGGTQEYYYVRLGAGWVGSLGCGCGYSNLTEEFGFWVLFCSFWGSTILLGVKCKCA